MNHKTTVKLVWVLVTIVLLVGAMRLVMVHNASQSEDGSILIRKGK